MENSRDGSEWKRDLVKAFLSKVGMKAPVGVSRPAIICILLLAAFYYHSLFEVPVDPVGEAAAMEVAPAMAPETGTEEEAEAYPDLVTAPRTDARDPEVDYAVDGTARAVGDTGAVPGPTVDIDPSLASVDIRNRNLDLRLVPVPSVFQPAAVGPVVPGEDTDRRDPDRDTMDQLLNKIAARVVDSDDSDEAAVDTGTMKEA